MSGFCRRLGLRNLFLSKPNQHGQLDPCRCSRDVEDASGIHGSFSRVLPNGFHFASQSYGGHYGPIFNEYIIQQNELIDCGELDAHHIDLRSVQIGNGWYDPVVQFGSYYNYTVSPGNPYNYSPYNVSTTAMLHNNMYGPGNCLDQAIDCNLRGDNTLCAAADAFCIAQVQNIWNPITERSQYDMRQLTPDPFPYSFFTDYLNSPKVQHAVGAFTNYSRSSSTVSAAFRNTGDDAREAGTYAAVARLLEAGVYVYEYAGDAGESLPILPQNAPPSSTCPC